MNKPIIHYWLGAGLVLCCSLLPTSCKDSDFDFDNIDTLLGIGGEDLTLPTNNSTHDIKLDDFLDLDDNNFLSIAPNGDYVLSMTDDNDHSASAEVDQIHLNYSQISGGSIPTAIGTGSGVISSFEFNNQRVSADILALNRIAVTSRLHISISIPPVVRSVSSMSLTLPSYLDITAATLDGRSHAVGSGNTIDLSGISSGSHSLVCSVGGINIGGQSTANGFATFDANAHTITIHGSVTATATLRQSDFTAEGLQQLQQGNISRASGSLSLGEIVATGATGRFAPGIDFAGLGDVSLNDVPDFLTDKQVCLDLYDPHIDLRFSNQLPMGGRVSGTMRALDAGGSVIASVAIPSFSVQPGNSVVSIRKQNTTAGADTTTVIVPSLSDLIKTIPARIEFVNIHAQADGSTTATVLLGHNYNVSARYDFNCPLQFDTDASIVYTDVLDGWNSGVKDLSFAEFTTDGQTTIDGYVQAEMDVSSKVPAYMTLTAWGIDTNGDSISTRDLQVTVDRTIAASTDGTTPATTHVIVKLQPTTNSVFTRLDGISYRLVASASATEGSPVAGQTINAYRHTLTVSNIAVSKHGKVVYDAN